MGREPESEALPTTPLAVESALRRVRVLSAVLVTIRLVAAHVMPVWAIAVLVVVFLSFNLVSMFSRGASPRTRAVFAIVQLAVDTVVVLFVVGIHQDGANSTDWALLVLPVIEGAIQFQMEGAIATWTAIASGYGGWTLAVSHNLPATTIAQRLAIVLFVALPSGFLAESLVAEITAHRRGRDEAEHRGTLLRAAALDGRKSTTLDIDEILDVLRDTITDMGFTEPQVFELTGTAPRLVAEPVRYSRDEPLPPNEQRLDAADSARTTGAAVMWPPEDEHTRRLTRQRDAFVRYGRYGYSRLFAVPVAEGEAGTIVLVARWPSPGLPPSSQTERLELFAAQAGASLRNAQVYLELEALKDRLAHEASHDALTELPNRRRFHEELERMCGRGRPEDSLAVLFLDLDGFKGVNDRFGHDAGNELLVSVADRLRSCIRPGDVVARMGGDEFTIMLTRIENAAPVIEIADRVCALLQDDFVLDSGIVQISTSIGIALAPADTADPGDLVRRADVAMYRAKSQGKAGWAMDPGSLPDSGDVPDASGTPGVVGHEAESLVAHEPAIEKP